MSEELEREIRNEYKTHAANVGLPDGSPMVPDVAAQLAAMVAQEYYETRLGELRGAVNAYELSVNDEDCLVDIARAARRLVGESEDG